MCLPTDARRRPSICCSAHVTDRIAKGKASFERTGCWQCHGRQGQGGRESPRIASPVPMSWPVLSRFVRTTKADMPPYTESVLSNQELADIYAYLRSMPPAPDFRTIPLLNGMMPTAERH